jgi:Putative transposase
VEAFFFAGVMTVHGAMPRGGNFKQTLCADMEGFSCHAAVRCGSDDWQALEQLCRYIARPALANEGVQTYVAGQVVLKLKLKTAWRAAERWARRPLRRATRPTITMRDCGEICPLLSA